MPSSGDPADGAIDGLREHEKERASARYERLEEIGRGAMAVVYRARDRQLDRFVALKMLHGEKVGSQVLKRFAREAAAAARLSHPNIVPVHDAGEDFIVMELIQGRTLHAAYATMDLRSKVDALRKVALAVQHAHEHGVVHRDLKPQNVLVDVAGEPRVGDFGLAHLLDSEALTRTGAQLGTPIYMAPEQATGRVHEIDAQTDVWALGVMLYEAMAGAVPFSGATMMEVLHRITTSDPPPVPKAPRDLETIALKAMDKDKRRRYASAAEFAGDLRRWLAGEPILARPVSTLTLIARRAGRHRMALVAVAFAAVAGAGWFAYAGKRTPPDTRRRDADAVLEAAKKHYEDALVSLYNEQAPMDDLASLAKQGITSCDAALAIFPEHEEALHLRGRLRLLAGDEAGAEADFTKSVELGGKRALIDRGRLRLERYYDRTMLPSRRDAADGLLREAALKDLEAAAGLGGDDAAFAQTLMAVLDGKGDARARCESFLASSRRKELGHWLLGVLDLRRDPASAERALSESIRWRRKWDRSHYARGMALAAQGRVIEAMRDLERAVELNARNAWARVSLGYLQLLANRLDAAMASFTAADGIEPGVPEVKLNIGTVHARRGEIAKAVALWEEVLAKSPREHRAMVNLALVEQGRGRHEEAILWCNRALEAEGSVGVAYALRGQSKRELGDLAGARADFRKSVEADPECALGLEEMGRAAGSAEEALAWFTKAVKAEPGRHGARVNRGQAYTQLRRFEEAAEDFETVLRVEPRHAAALRGRGTLKFEQGEYDEAIDDLTQALVAEPGDEIAIYMRGAAFTRLSRWKEALADFERLERAANPQIRQKVGMVIEEVRRKARGE